MTGEKYAGRALEGGKRLALVVGVNSAPKSLLPPLQSACRDAEAVAHVLRTHCYFTLLEPPLLEEQATSATIKKTILDLIEQGESNDFLLFYFSGHGQPMNVEAGRNEVYLGTHDFVEKQVERDETLHLSLPWLRDKLFQQTKAGKVLLVLDCCYSGEVGRSGPDPYLEELQQRLSYYFGRPGAATGAPTGGLRQALTATGHNMPAQESRVYGRMTSFLLPALRGEVPETLGQQKLLTLWRLVDYLKESYEQPPKPALSGDDAGQDCILAYFPSASTSKITTSSGPIDAKRPASYLPFPRNPFFQPRPGEFEHLEHLLFPSGTRQSVPLGLVGVTGMGGVGKTQLAVELAYRYQQRFPGGIFWMSATGQNLFDWQRTLADLAVKTNFLPPEDDPTNPEHEVRRARHLCRYFASHADVLVILDNVEVPHLVTTALVDMAGGTLACTVLYTSRQRTPPAGVTLYPVEVLSEEGALRLLLESTRPALLAKVLAGETSSEVEAVHQICRATGSLPLALTILQSLLARDRKLSLYTLANTLQERGVLTLPSTGIQQTTLKETFQLSWRQVRDERARRFFLLVSLFPEAAPVPLWLAGLAAGLGERAQPINPLWEINLSLQELSLLEGLTDDQIRLHPLVRAFGQQMLQQEKEQGRILRAEAGARLVGAFKDLTLLEQRARRTTYRDCLEQLRAASDYAHLLFPWSDDQLNRLERWLDRESYLLGDEQWWPKTLPALFYQQFYNRSVEEGHLLEVKKAPMRWLRQENQVNAEDQALLRVFAGHSQSVRSVAFSPDGRTILTGSDDQTTRLWKTASGKQLQSFLGHTGVVRSVAFSPDGTKVLTGSQDDGTARLWETTSGQLLATFESHTGPVHSVAFSPDGSKVLIGSDKGTARLWEVASGKLLETLKENDDDSVLSVAFSPDGNKVLTGMNKRSAVLWELPPVGEAHEFFPNDLMRFRFRQVPRVIWSCDTGYTVYGVAFSPDGNKVLIGTERAAHLGEPDTARLSEYWYGPEDHHLLGYYGESVYGVAFSPDGSKVLIGSNDGTAQLWEIANKEHLKTFEGHTGPVHSVAFSPDGTKVLTGSGDGTARLWEVASEPLQTSLEGYINIAVYSAVFSPDGTKLLTSKGDRTGVVQLWEVASGNLLQTFKGHTDFVAGVVFSPDGTKVLTGSQDGTARLWEATSGNLLQMFKGRAHWVHSVAFSPDGTKVLTGSGDGTARLWAVASGKRLQTFKVCNLAVRRVAFSPDGTKVLTSSEDGAVQLWAVASGKRLQTFIGKGFYLVQIAFSPDGTKVLTGSGDGTAQLWEATSGNLLQTFKGHTGWIGSVAFSPDGHVIVTSDSNGRVFFWHVHKPEIDHLLGVYVATHEVSAIHWRDAVHVVLADTGRPSHRLHIYRLKLEGQW